jgi:D-tyrosyl-tRNA(Tyr) deacylase
MRAVVQRVSRAKVVVQGQTVGEIAGGLLVYLGVAGGDTEDDARTLAEKIVNLRIFPDEQGKFNLSLADVNGALLAVSQFTLLGDCRKGRRPSMIDAAAPDVAEPLYRKFGELVAAAGRPVQWGKFGAHMEIESVNDGPVTFLLDTKKGD